MSGLQDGGPPMTRIKWTRRVLDWHDLTTGYRSRDVVVWPYHALDEGDVHPGGGYRTQCGHSLMTSVTLYERPPGVACPQCADRLAGRTGPHCAHHAQRHRPEASGDLLAAAVTRRQVASRVVELVLALAEETPTLPNAQRRELRALAARGRPG